MNQSPPAFAYVAQGKLYSQLPGESPKLVESVFVQTILDRVETSRSRNQWKSAGMAWNFGSMRRGGMPQVPVETRRIRFAGVTAAEPREIIYTIDTDYVCGLFHYDMTNGQERRLFHRNEFRATDLSRHEVDGALVFTVHAPDGTSHLAMLNGEGRGIRELTEGDAIDEAPSWVPGTAKVVLFQSAGIGRNQRGMHTSLSPYAIQRLDLDNNKMEMVIEEDTHDVLLPKMDREGTLYFIRRPYHPHGQPVSPLRVIADLLLAPVRLLLAIGYFLNFFSILFSQKPLMTAGGPPKEGPDERIMMLWGRVVDTRRVMRSPKAGEAALVPANWQLTRRDERGNETVLARSVLCYDLCGDGTIVYTDGTRIFHLSEGGKANEICKGRLIERVAALRV